MVVIERKVCFNINLNSSHIEAQKNQCGQPNDWVPLHIINILPVWFGEVKSVPNIARITLSRFKAKKDWFNPGV